MKACLEVSGNTEFSSPVQLADFTRKHARGGVIHRDTTKFSRALVKGVMVAVVRTDIEAGAPDRLLAIAGILPLKLGLFEMGAALVRKDATGFALQRFMFEARLALYSIRKIAPFAQLVSAAGRASYGDGSRHILERAGFETMPHAEGPIEFRKDCRTCRKDIPDDAVCCYQYYRASKACERAGYEPGSQLITRKRDGAELQLTLPDLAETGSGLRL